MNHVDERRCVQRTDADQRSRGSVGDIFSREVKPGAKCHLAEVAVSRTQQSKILVPYLSRG